MSEKNIVNVNVNQNGLNVIESTIGGVRIMVASHQAVSSIEKTSGGIKVAFETNSIKNVDLKLDGKVIAKVMEHLKSGY